MKNSIQGRLDKLQKKLNLEPQNDPTVYYFKTLSEALRERELRREHPEKFEGKRIVYDPLVEKELKRIFSLPKRPPDPEHEKRMRQLKKEHPDNIEAWKLLDPFGEYDEKPVKDESQGA